LRPETFHESTTELEVSVKVQPSLRKKDSKRGKGGGGSWRNQAQSQKEASPLRKHKNGPSLRKACKKEKTGKSGGESCGIEKKDTNGKKPPGFLSGSNRRREKKRTRSLTRGEGGLHVNIKKKRKADSQGENIGPSE